MELGGDGVLVNRGMCSGKERVKMGEGMKLGIDGGRVSYEGGGIGVK